MKRAAEPGDGVRPGTTRSGLGSRSQPYNPESWGEGVETNQRLIDRRQGAVTTGGKAPVTRLRHIDTCHPECGMRQVRA